MRRANYYFKINSWISIIIGSLYLWGLTGCSEVSFSPAAGYISSVECEDANNCPSPPPPVNCQSLGNCPVATDKVTDRFVQEGTAPKVDILFVIDNSASMYEEQLKLGDRIKSFISHLETLDWQIAATTTDVSTGAFGLKGSFLEFTNGNGRILTKNTPDFEKVFLNTISRPESNCGTWDCASADERPLMASIMAIEKSVRENADFFRKDSDLVIVYLSDEDEGSTGGSGVTQGIDVVNNVKDFFGDKSFTAYGLIVEPGDKQCLNAGYVGSPHYVGQQVFNLVQVTGGVTGSICDNDYGRTLTSIGKRVRQLTDRVELSQDPSDDEIKVKLTPKQEIRFQRNGRFVSFDSPPAEGTVIEVEYKAKKEKDRKDD